MLRMPSSGSSHTKCAWQLNYWQQYLQFLVKMYNYVHLETDGNMDTKVLALLQQE